jgi:hypothetical protein
VLILGASKSYKQARKTYSKWDERSRQMSKKYEVISNAYALHPLKIIP